jgi:hypothetical protein
MINLVELRCHRHLLGNGPQKAHQFPGNGDDHLVGVFAAGQQASKAFAQAHVCLPTEVLNRRGELLQPELYVATDVGGIPVGPGAFDQGAAGMGVPGCGDRPLSASLPAGIFCRDQAEICHQLSGILAAGQVAEFGHEGHGDDTLDAPQRWQRLDHGLQAPGVPVVVQCLLQSLQAFGVRSDSANICLEHHRWRRCGTDHCGEPPEMGRAPGGPARIPDILPEQAGFETELGRFEIPHGIFAGAGEIAHGFVLDRGDIHGGEIPRAHQASQLHGVTTVGFHAVAGLLGDARGRNDPARMAFVREIAVEPVATGARFLDEDQVLGF